jgi:threonine dehydrogenase-like Zn-dependent dehydrogenase
MVNRGGRICLAAFPATRWRSISATSSATIFSFRHPRRRQERNPPRRRADGAKALNAKMIHTHTFPLAQVPTAIKYARERNEDAIKVVVKIRES